MRSISVIVAGPAHRQLDFGVGRHGNGLELIGRDHLHLVTHVAAFIDNAGQGSHDAVDLGRPGVGDQKDLHRRLISTRPGARSDGPTSTRSRRANTAHRKLLSDGLLVTGC